jgi:hypothetical protein
MAREDYDSLLLKKGIATAAAMFELGRFSSKPNKSGSIARLAAEGLKQQFRCYKFRPPVDFLNRLSTEGVFAFYTRWNDAIETAAGFPGPLGNTFSFAAVDPEIRYAEAGQDTYLPVSVGMCQDDDSIATKDGSFPAFRDVHFADELTRPLTADELDSLENWLKSKE